MLVDAGDFSADVALEAQARNKWVLEGLRRMDYAAINIGELEVIEETERWKELGGADLPWISTNAVLPAGSPVQPRPYIIQEIQSARGRTVRVGFLGLAAPAPAGLAIEFADPVERARSYAAELAGRVDVLVALAQMTVEDARELVKAAPAIDIVLGAEKDTQTIEPLFEGDSLILYPVSQGMTLGDLRLFFGDDGRPSRFFFRVVPLPSELEDHPDWVEFQQQAESEIKAAKSP